MGIKKLFVVKGKHFDNKPDAKAHRDVLIGQGQVAFVIRGVDNVKSGRNGRKAHHNVNNQPYVFGQNK